MSQWQISLLKPSLLIEHYGLSDCYVIIHVICVFFWTQIIADDFPVVICLRQIIDLPPIIFPRCYK